METEGCQQLSIHYISVSSLTDDLVLDLSFEEMKRGSQYR